MKDTVLQKLNSVKEKDMTSKEKTSFANFLKSKVENPLSRNFAFDTRGFVPQILSEKECLLIMEDYFDASWYDNMYELEHEEFPLIRYSAEGFHELTGTIANPNAQIKTVSLKELYQQWKTIYQINPIAFKKLAPDFEFKEDIL